MKDSFAWFKDMVRDRRKLEAADLDRVTDGRVFTGRQAIELKLADEIGREKDAIAWLAKTSGINADTPVRDWRLHSTFKPLSMLHLAASRVLDRVGLGRFSDEIEIGGALQAAEKLNLDGLLMVWHPAAGN